MDITEFCKQVAEFYSSPFGGRKNGRFLISRKNVAIMLGLSYVKEVTIDRIADELSQDYGITLINYGHEMAFLRERNALRWRKVSLQLIHKAMGIKPGDTENDEDGDDEID
jgi:hypothetical protein